jgi:pimeloyl-ACP methyl ester carboxylesterase
MLTTRRLVLAYAFFAFVLGLLTTRGALAAQRDEFFDVKLRGTDTTKIHAIVYENPRHRPGVTVLAVHGFTETATTYGPLASAIFSDSVLGHRIARVISLDLIGHGQSPAPTSVPVEQKFGDLTIEDNVSTVLQSIDILRARGLGARVIIGHSMGGLTVMAAQDALLSQGSSLAAHGIFTALLLAPVPPGNATWTLGPQPDLSPFVVTDPVLGTFLQLPPPIAQIGGGYTTLAGTLAPNAPTVEEIATQGYHDKEPITVALQLTGAIPLPRPSVRARAFSFEKGTTLILASFSQDVLVPAGDLDDVYTLLTGWRGPLYRPVVADDAIHSMFITNPKGMLKGLAGAW